MKVAEHIAHWLREKEIRAFGIIGGGNVILWDAVKDIVCVHHEQAAVMAAAYYYRVSGKLGVALVTTGAGSTNALTGVMAAYMDSIPVLIISGNEASHYLSEPQRVKGVQGYRSAMFARPMTKEAMTLNEGNYIRALEDAYAIGLSPRQGPVWLDCPKDVQNAVV